MIPGGAEWYIAGNGQLRRQTRLPYPPQQSNATSSQYPFADLVTNNGFP